MYDAGRVHVTKTGTALCTACPPKARPVRDQLRIVMSRTRTEWLRVAAVALVDGYRRQGLEPD